MQEGSLLAAVSVRSQQSETAPTQRAVDLQSNADEAQSAQQPASCAQDRMQLVHVQLAEAQPKAPTSAGSLSSAQSRPQQQQNMQHSLQQHSQRSEQTLRQRDQRLHLAAQQRAQSSGSQQITSPSHRKGSGRLNSTAGAVITKQPSTAAQHGTNSRATPGTVHSIESRQRSMRSTSGKSVHRHAQEVSGVLDRTMAAVKSSSVDASSRRAAAAVSSIDALLQQKGGFK